MWERNIDRLPPVCALTRGQTQNLLVHGRMLQPTEPTDQGNIILSLLISIGRLWLLLPKIESHFITHCTALSSLYYNSNWSNRSLICRSPQNTDYLHSADICKKPSLSAYFMAAYFYISSAGAHRSSTLAKCHNLLYYINKQLQLVIFSPWWWRL